MSIWKPFRILYIRTTDLTHGFQGEESSKVITFYRFWSVCYDLTVKIDPAYQRELNNMVSSVVKQGDTCIDIGCGTGLGTVYAASIAKKVVAIDPSSEMTNKLYKKIHKQNIDNIEIRNGYFPQALVEGDKCDSIISSFMMAHLRQEERCKLLSEAYKNLVDGGRIGLFSAQGEIASTFETKDEIIECLSSAGFQDINITEVSDIYRISTATKASNIN